MGVFTPQELADATHQGFFFFFLVRGRVINHLLMYRGHPGASVPHLTMCAHVPVHGHVCLSTCASVDTCDLCVPACLCLCTRVKPSAAFLFGSWFHRKLLGWGRECRASPPLPTHLLRTPVHTGLTGGGGCPASRTQVCAELRPTSQVAAGVGGARHVGRQLRKRKLRLSWVTCGYSGLWPTDAPSGSAQRPPAMGRAGCRSW